MYLARSIRWGTRQAEMVGVIPGDVVMQPRPVGRGYVHLEASGDCGWSPAPAGGLLRGHEFHHSCLVNLPPDTRFAYRVRRGHGIDGVHDGVCIHNVLASYAHLRSGAGADWAARFVDFVCQVGWQAPSGAAACLALAA
jgi:cobyrinic acid a,c-diamide synthase